MTEPSIAAWEYQRAAMGAFIRSQRELANMSLRQLSQATQVSNAYLSQIERGMHDPTVRVLLQIGQALHFSVEDASASNDVETAIRHDAVLSAPEKEALLAVYRSYLKSHDS